MKHFLLLTLIVGLTSVAFAQSAGSTQKPSSRNAAQEGEREKFDPLRDSAADLQNAVAVTQKNGRRIILDVGGEWCGWCRYMDKFFFLNPVIERIRKENFVWVKVNMSPENENKLFLSAYPAITGYPHLFVLDADGKLLHSQPTDVLESDKGYDLARFTEFLKAWSPVKAVESKEKVDGPK